VKFGVEYTDASGRRWRQHYGGKVEPIFTTEAIPVREADRFQPPQQIRRISDLEARRLGGQFARHLPPLENDDEIFEVLGSRVVATWRPIERVGQPAVRPQSDRPGEVSIKIGFAPAGPPFWRDYFTDKLKENGFSQYKGHTRGGEYQSITLRCPQDHTANVGALVDEAIDYANRQFEANELAAAQRALARRQPGRPPPPDRETGDCDED
jgi:hypothetical protein